MFEHRLVAQHAATLDRARIADANGLSVARRAEAQARAKAFVRDRIIDDAGNGPAFADDPGADREMRFPADKGNRAVDGIDHEGERLRQSRCVVLCFFRQPAIVRSRTSKLVGEELVDGKVCLGDRAALVFAPALEFAAEEPPGDVPGLAYAFLEQSKIADEVAFRHRRPSCLPRGSSARWSR